MPVETRMKLSPTQAGKLFMKSLKQEDRIKELEERNKSLAACLHNNIVSQQSAWIEWQHGKGSEAAMSWVNNDLRSAGLIPGEDEPNSTNAQDYFNANNSHRCVETEGEVTV